MKPYLHKVFHLVQIGFYYISIAANKMKIHGCKFTHLGHVFKHKEQVSISAAGTVHIISGQVIDGYLSVKNKK